MRRVYYNKNTKDLAFCLENETLDENYYNSIIVSDDIFQNLICTPIGYVWSYINNEFQLRIKDPSLIEKEKLNRLRVERMAILQAFDIYKANVFYGIESDENHNSIMSWYHSVLDLNEEAINNPPQEITRYMS